MAIHLANTNGFMQPGTFLSSLVCRHVGNWKALCFIKADLESATILRLTFSSESPLAAPLLISDLECQLCPHAVRGRGREGGAIPSQVQSKPGLS